MIDAHQPIGHESYDPSGPPDPSHLGVVRREVEPVRRLRRHGDVRGAVAENPGFRPSDDVRDVWMGRGVHDLFSACVGGDHAGEAIRQQHGELAGPASRVPGEVRPRSNLAKKLGQSRGIGRPMRRVGSRCSREVILEAVATRHNVRSHVWPSRSCPKLWWRSSRTR